MIGPRDSQAGATIREERGARAVEAALIEELSSRLVHSADRGALLSEPLRVIVPSRSLRWHVGSRLVRHFGRALLGVVVQTLYGAAFEILERAERAAPRGKALFPIAVRQCARAEPVLREPLDALQDGYALVAESASDLLDAGLEPAMIPALEEALRGAGDAGERAAAIVRVAIAADSTLRQAGLGRDNDVFALARESLEARGADALPARAIWVHGFADATGVAARFLSSLLQECGARLLLDLPPDPADPSQDDPGCAFARSFAARLGHASVEHPSVPRPHPPAIELIHAPGSDAEVRSIAERVARAIDGGARPEAIGIVARALDPYAIALRSQLTRLGVPFSGIGATAPPGSLGRRCRALLDLVRQREQAAADVWLDADASLSASAHLADLRIGLHALGAARIGAVARISPAEVLDGRSSLPLPVRRGLEAPDEERGEERGRAPRRYLTRGALERAIATARALLERWEAWPSNAPVSSHLERVRALARNELSWSPEEITEALAAIADLEDSTFEVDYEDFALLLRSVLEAAGRPLLGGDGGGVQVLDVTEARGRTFGHLFALGLNRDVFPRVIRDDSLLPDALRERLRTVLALPMKSLGFDEERYLFAQLLSASAHVTLSWQLADDEARLRAPSPLVERLRLARSTPEPIVAPSIRAASSTDAPRTPLERAVLAGLHADRVAFAGLLSVALEEACPGDGGAGVAAARLAVLEEIDPATEPNGAVERELGPWFGFVGRARLQSDPRPHPLWITTLEGIARCPWQTFLERVLRVEPTPDALEALPALDPRVIGNTVHAALEQIGRRAGAPRGAALERVLSERPVDTAWPDEAELRAILASVTDEIARAEGVALPGFARALAEVAQPYLEAVRARDWERNGTAVALLGVEVEGSCHSPTDPRPVRFRADRVDRRGEVVRLTDYKVGRPFSAARTASTRTGHFLAEVRAGRRLQPVAYVLAVGESPAEGRFVFAKPDGDEESAVASVSSEQSEFREAFDAATGAALRAWDLGSFFPRVMDPDGREEPRSCTYCSVAEACNRHDSGMLTRLVDWALPRAEDASLSKGDSEAERALSAVWALGRRTEQR